MRTVPVSSNDLNFGKALPTCKKASYTKTIRQAKKVLGIASGLSLLKIHSASMPHQDEFDTGVGKLNSQPAIDFIRNMTFYTDTNAVKVFPSGQTTKNFGRYYCPYLKTSVTFGEENINLLNIVKDKSTYGKILTKDDILNLNVDDGSQTWIYYENELMDDENYPILKPLKIAHENFKKGLAPEKLTKEFEKYKQKKIVSDKYARLALYPFLKDKEPDLFVNFDNSPEKQAKYDNYKKIYKDEIEFFQFRQFLAQKEHDNAKKEINKNGTKLFGDCLIGFSDQDIWAEPDAFRKDLRVGSAEWGLISLNFEKILDESTPAHKVFEEKITFFLENYDGIRFDVGWCYAIAKLFKPNGEEVYVDLGHDLIDFIEKTAKNVKGDNFDTKNLIYEMDGAGHLFQGWEKDEKVKAKPNLKDIVGVYTTQWQESAKNSWGNPDFLKSTGLSEDEFIVGTNNHDGTPLRVLAEESVQSAVDEKKKNVILLSKLFKIPKQKLKDIPLEFIKAKFAQLYTVKNQFLFFIDVLGLNHEMDDQTDRTSNFRFRLNKDPERQYHTALQQGQGFNLPEALFMVMKQKKLDKANPELSASLEYFAKYLRKPGAKTEAEANAQEK